MQFFVITVAKQILADDFHARRFRTQQLKLEELLGMLGFIQRRVRRAIGKHQAVHTKLAIVWAVAKITAIGCERYAVSIAFEQ